MSNLVVQAQDWDERGRGVKTDRVDALPLCQRLGRYVRGKREAFSAVRVPAGEEERERATSQQRGQLVRERKRRQFMGRSSLAMHGIHGTGKWLIHGVCSLANTSPWTTRLSRSHRDHGHAWQAIGG